MKAALFSLALLTCSGSQISAALPTTARRPATGLLIMGMKLTMRFSRWAIVAAVAGILVLGRPMTAYAAAPDPSITADNPPLTDNSTPADVFESMRRGFNAAASKGVHAHYQFDISGPMGGTWWIIVNDGEFSMGKGPTEKPDVIMTSTDKDWVMLATGSLGGFRAFITGRLKVTGDQGLAHKLGDIFP